MSKRGWSKQRAGSENFVHARVRVLVHVYAVWIESENSHKSIFKRCGSFIDLQVATDMAL